MIRVIVNFPITGPLIKYHFLESHIATAFSMSLPHCFLQLSFGSLKVWKVLKSRINPSTRKLQFPQSPKMIKIQRKKIYTNLWKTKMTTPLKTVESWINKWFWTNKKIWSLIESLIMITLKIHQQINLSMVKNPISSFLIRILRNPELSLKE